MQGLQKDTIEKYKILSVQLVRIVLLFKVSVPKHLCLLNYANRIIQKIWFSSQTQLLLNLALDIDYIESVTFYYHINLKCDGCLDFIRKCCSIYFYFCTATLLVYTENYLLFSTYSRLFLFFISNCLFIEVFFD